jgi:hypothetical protein
MEGVVFESIKEEDARTWGSACTQLALTGACNPRLYGIPDGDPSTSGAIAMESDGTLVQQ